MSPSVNMLLTKSADLNLQVKWMEPHMGFFHWHWSGCKPSDISFQWESGNIPNFPNPFCVLKRHGNSAHSVWSLQFPFYKSTMTQNSKWKYGHSVLHIFLAPYRTKCPGDQILIGLGCPDDAKTVWLHTYWKQNMLLWTKQEKLKFTSLKISLGKAAAGWLLIMNWYLVQP